MISNVTWVWCAWRVLYDAEYNFQRHHHPIGKQEFPLQINWTIKKRKALAFYRIRTFMCWYCKTILNIILFWPQIKKKTNVYTVRLVWIQIRTDKCISLKIKWYAMLLSHPNVLNLSRFGVLCVLFIDMILIVKVKSIQEWFSFVPVLRYRYNKVLRIPAEGISRKAIRKHSIYNVLF